MTYPLLFLMGINVQENLLEKKTVITFNDGENEFERSYEGLLSFVKGETIALDYHAGNDTIPVSRGDYLFLEGPNDALSLEVESRTDRIYRYYVFNKKQE